MFSKKKQKRVICKPSIVIQAMQETIDIDAGCISIEFAYREQRHKVGIASDYDRRQGFFDTVYYLDDQEFSSFEAFKNNAMLTGTRFTYIDEKLEILLVDDSKPTYYKFFEDYVEE